MRSTKSLFSEICLKTKETTKLRKLLGILGSHRKEFDTEENELWFASVSHIVVLLSRSQNKKIAKMKTRKRGLKFLVECLPTLGLVSLKILRISIYN